MICEEIVYAKEGKTEDEILKHRYLGNAKESKQSILSAFHEEEKKQLFYVSGAEIRSK